MIYRLCSAPRTLALSFTALAAGAALFVAGCTGIPEGLTPVGNFDAHRFAGRWYEIARLDHRFERGLTDVTAEYTVLPHGKLTVVNRGFDVEKGEWKEIDGTARFQGRSDVGSLSVTFFWPFAGGYHVVALDPAYEWAMVVGPSREYLWILARGPSLPVATYDFLVQQAKDWNFPIGELIEVAHGVGPAQ